MSEPCDERLGAVPCAGRRYERRRRRSCAHVFAWAAALALLALAGRLAVPAPAEAFLAKTAPKEGAVASGRPAAAAPAPSAVGPRPDPWQTYVDAAVELAISGDAESGKGLIKGTPALKALAALKAVPATCAAGLGGDFQGAEGLLQAALDVTRQSDPKDPRSVITRYLLRYDYLALERFDAAKAVSRGGIRIDRGQLTEKFLPLAPTLQRLALHAYDRAKELDQCWQEISKSPGTGQQDALSAVAVEVNFRIGFALAFLKLETAIYERAAPRGDSDTATAIALQGLILKWHGKLQEAKDKYESALEIWDNLAARSRQLSAQGRRLALFPIRFSDQSGGGVNPFLVRILLARIYVQIAEDELQNKQAGRANEHFGRAEKLYKDDIRLLERFWPYHTQVGLLYGQLGYLYQQAKRLPDAEQAYCRRLAVDLAIQGPKGPKIKDEVDELAALLRNAHRPSDAAALAARCGVAPQPLNN